WELDGGPFEMLAAPSTVGRALLDLIARMLRLDGATFATPDVDESPPGEREGQPAAAVPAPNEPSSAEPDKLEGVERQIRESFAELRHRLSDAVLGSVIAETLDRLERIEKALDAI